MKLPTMVEQILALLPRDCQAVNKLGDTVVIIEMPGRIPLIANLSQLSETKLTTLATRLGVLVE